MNAVKTSDSVMCLSYHDQNLSQVDCVFLVNPFFIDYDVNIGDECIVGALCFVKGEMQIPDRKIVVGNPAEIKGDVSDDMINWKTKGTQLYQELPEECKKLMKECSPLSEINENRKEKQKITFDTWKKTQWKNYYLK